MTSSGSLSAHKHSFAWISTSRAVFLVDELGKVCDPALPIESMMWGSFSVIAKQSAAFSWPTWSPDGRTVYFTSRRDGNYQLYGKPADGS